MAHEEVLTYPRICWGVWNRTTSAWIRNYTEARAGTWRGLFKAVFKRRPFVFKGPTVIPFFADIDDAVFYKRWAEYMFARKGEEVNLYVMPVEIPAAHIQGQIEEAP